MSSVIDGLNQALANTVVLTVLTQKTHWNIIGSDFFQLHKALGHQYEDLFETQDVIAERIRALDEPVKACLTEMETQAAMPCISSSFSARGMIDALITAHEKNVKDLMSLCAAARDGYDPVTENLAADWLQMEQKTLWQLKSWTK